MADSLVTQVARDDSTKKATSEATKPKLTRRNSTRYSLFSSLLCCFSPAAAAARTRAQNEQEAPTNELSWPADPGHELLPPREPALQGKKCLVLDLDETLVHSSFKPVPNADFVVPIDIDGIIHHVYVMKRPGVDQFLRRMGELFEVVLFTASLAKYADPVSDLLDIAHVFKYRLFREHCVFHRGAYVKDLSRLGRNVNETCIIDNSPVSYVFHPEYAVAITSWFEDPSDRELIEMIPMLEELAATTDTVKPVLANWARRNDK